MDGELLIAYFAILFMAITPIYFGAHLSLKQTQAESMSTSDAAMFPFIASAVLLGLYILFKFEKDILNKLFTVYFIILGILSLAASFKLLLSLVLPKSLTTHSGKTITIPAFWRTKVQNEKDKKIVYTITILDVLGFILSGLVGIWYVQTKHWISNNLFGLAFSMQAIEYLHLGDFKVGCILLGGLFFYDIFWVFGTEAMVFVAKSLDAPIKLIFPKAIFSNPTQYSMLGLGDIVIPGIFIALLLRFDKSLKKGVSKKYFYTCFAAYILGLVTTILVMHVFQAAQPALLYLVPFCIGSATLRALVSGEFNELLKYSDEKKTEKKTDEKKN